MASLRKRESSEIKETEGKLGKQVVYQIEGVDLNELVIQLISWTGELYNFYPEGLMVNK